jgi:phenylpropionate dioxygenase-like ring-hydroxylating dioxygenase large terminal subunit
VTAKPEHEGPPPDGRENWVVKGTYSYVFPNFMCNAFPGPTNVFMRKLMPIGPNRTRVQYEQFCTDDVTDQEAVDVTAVPHQIFEEDIPICEAVQRGTRSGFFEGGRLLLPYHENGPHHFQKLVYLALTDQIVDDPSRANGVPERTLPVG